MRSPNVVNPWISPALRHVIIIGTLQQRSSDLDHALGKLVWRIECLYVKQEI